MLTPIGKPAQKGVDHTNVGEGTSISSSQNLQVPYQKIDDRLGDISEKLDPKHAQVWVLRLDGDKTGTSIPKLEGAGFNVNDVGNTFTLTGQYLSYGGDWLGDAVQDAELDWNGLTYKAGSGAGTAGYAHSGLPTLTEGSVNEFHTAPIILMAKPGAVLEFRYKVLT